MINNKFQLLRFKPLKQLQIKIKTKHLSKTGTSFYHFQNPFSCIYIGQVSIFKANLVEIDRVVFPSSAATQTYVL